MNLGKRLKGATLAVGTEVTDGQIIDRNSAWLSQKMTQAGIEVIEHRAVADDREEIRRALRDLTSRVNFIFVTGGLGPTSDDITRELLAEVFGRPLEYDSESWRQIEEKLSARGITTREIQRQQCYYPKGARVLFNPTGTANAFALDEPNGLKVFAMPGPPSEIAAVWDQSLASEFERLVPVTERETLRILRCLGRGESDIAEKTEEAIRGSRLRVGYRAHMPYVEVKLWYLNSDTELVEPALEKLESVLSPWIVNRDNEDVADQLLDRASQGQLIQIRDAASCGVLLERLNARMKERQLSESSCGLSIETVFPGASAVHSSQSADAAIWIELSCDESANQWKFRMKTRDSQESTLEVSPLFHYKVQSERGRKYVTERALNWIGSRIEQHLG